MKNINNYGIYGLLVALAISAASLEAAENLRNYYWNRDAQKKEAQANLEQAMYTQNLGRAQDAIDSGADVNKPNHGGYTPLLIATGSNNIDLARLLLSHGAQKTINIPGQFSQTPLWAAVHNNNLPLVELLISHGASLGKAIPNYNNTMPQITHLLHVTQVIKTDKEKLFSTLRAMSEEERANALRIMQARLGLQNSLSPGDMRYLAVLGDKKMQEHIRAADQAELNSRIKESTYLPHDLSDIVADYANPFYREKVHEAHSQEEIAEPDSKELDTKSKESL